MKKMFRNLLGIFISLVVLVASCGVIAAGDESDLEVDGFNILPELDEGEIAEGDAHIQAVGSEGGHVWDHYNDIADRTPTSQQLATGIMNRDTIMDYLVFVVKFISQLGLTVGVVFIMYAGYEYMLSVFKGGKAPTDTIKNAIIGVIIVIFSYAILKTLTSFIGLS